MRREVGGREALSCSTRWRRVGRWKGSVSGDEVDEMEEEDVEEDAPVPSAAAVLLSPIHCSP